MFETTTVAPADRPPLSGRTPVADGLRMVRADLVTIRARPMPPMAWPRWLRWLPHALVCPAAALAAAATDTTTPLVACAHAGTLVVALRWPTPAWWLSMAGLSTITLGYPAAPNSQLYVWMVHAGVLFLLTLRVRLVSAISAALLSTLLAVILKPSGRAVGSWSVIAGAALLFALAVLIGAVIRGRREDQARLTDQIAATAQERALRTVLEERTRIARELHDVVAHHMSLISIQADAAPYRVQDPPPELVTELASIRVNALDGLAELSHLLGLLRSDGDDTTNSTSPQPSLAQLDALLASVRAAGLHATVRIAGTIRPLSPGVELSAYRIIQEALSNVLRHAPGAETSIQLTYARDALHLRALNGPATLPVSPSPGSGHGLTGMRERAAMLGGDLATGPTPGGGYEVTATLPDPAASPATGKEPHQ
ncbi:sensor histidine kinase [Streptomyces sp. NPDC059650]|uniref:sensor histidine kinase n=1 Tax=Streptomyces sp. NPDC059650 TaxID=3346896 RepID=UPI00368234B3